MPFDRLGKFKNQQFDEFTSALLVKHGIIENIDNGLVLDSSHIVKSIYTGVVSYREQYRKDESKSYYYGVVKLPHKGANEFGFAYFIRCDFTGKSYLDILHPKSVESVKRMYKGAKDWGYGYYHWKVKYIRVYLFENLSYGRFSFGGYMNLKYYNGSGRCKVDKWFVTLSQRKSEKKGMDKYIINFMKVDKGKVIYEGKVKEIKELVVYDTSKYIDRFVNFLNTDVGFF